MFKGLTYFGVPLEYFLRSGEVMTILMILAVGGLRLYVRYEDKIDELFSKLRGISYDRNRK